MVSATYWQVEVFSKKILFTKTCKQIKNNKTKVQQEKKVTSKHDKERKKRTRTPITPKISSEISIAWLYIRLTSTFFLKIIVEQDAHLTGISGQEPSCSNKMTDCLQWLHKNVWYWHDDMCSYKLSSNTVWKIEAVDVDSGLQKPI